MLPFACLILSLVWASLIYAVPYIHPELSALVCIMHELGLDSPQWSESAAQSVLWALHITSFLGCMQTLGTRGWGTLWSWQTHGAELMCCHVSETGHIKAAALLAREGRKHFWRNLCTTLWRRIASLKCHFKRLHGKSAPFHVVPSNKCI